MIKLSYEQAVARLEEIVSLLESGNSPLQESMKLFQEGTELCAYCSKLLSTAKQKVSEISEDGGENDEHTN